MAGMSEWQGIETAPKDNRIAYLDYGDGTLWLGHWEVTDHWIGDANVTDPLVHGYWKIVGYIAPPGEYRQATERLILTGGGDRAPPSKWMPLPPPPPIPSQTDPLGEK